MDRLYRVYKFKADSFTDDSGTIEGYASVFGVLDWYGTIVDEGAFAKTIKDNDGEFPTLFFHDPMRPVGMSEVHEDKKGLRTKVALDLDTPDGHLMYSGAKRGYIDRFSIGFDVIEEAIEDEIPHYKEIRLWEDSLLTRNFAANPESLVDEVRQVRAAALGLQRVEKAIRGEAAEDLQKALADLRAVLLTFEAPEEEAEMPVWAQDILGEVRAANALLIREQPGEPTAGGEPQGTPSEPQAHSGLLTSLRNLETELRMVKS